MLIFFSTIYSNPPNSLAVVHLPTLLSSAWNTPLYPRVWTRQRHVESLTIVITWSQQKIFAVLNVTRDPGVGPQRRCRGQGLRAEHVQHGGAEHSLVQGGDYVLLLDHVTTSDIDKADIMTCLQDVPSIYWRILSIINCKIGWQLPKLFMQSETFCCAHLILMCAHLFSRLSVLGVEGSTFIK